MKNYYRVMLGKKSAFAAQAHEGNFIGVDFGIQQDLTRDLFENWREFNKKFIPIYLERRPDKTKVAAGLACGTVWTVAKGILVGVSCCARTVGVITTPERSPAAMSTIPGRSFLTDARFGGFRSPCREMQ